MIFSRNRLKHRAALHLERLEDRYVMDGAGFVHTYPEPDPDSVVGVAEIEAQDDYVETWLESGQIRIDVLANDPLPEGSAALKIKSVSQSARGATVTISDDGTRLLYTPPSEGFRFDSFYYIVEDGAGKVGKANVSIGRKYLPTGGTYNPPIGRDDSYRFLEDSPPQTLDVLANDGLSPDAEIIEVSAPEGLGGTVSIAEDGKSLVYQPPFGKVGTDFFYYTYRDADGETGTLQVTVNVSKPYQARSAYPNFTYRIGTGSHVLNVMDDDVQGSVYAQEPRIVEVSQSEYGGTLTISEDGRKVIFAPSEGFIGSIQFSYTVRYGPLDHQIAAGYEDVTVYNSFLAVDNWFAVDVDSGENELDVLANDPTLSYWRLADVTLSIIDVSAGSAGGQIAITSDNKVIYTPAAGFAGEETFTYTVRDSNGVLDSAHVTVLVREQVATDGVPKFILPGELEQFLIDQAVERYKHQFGLTFQKYVGPEYDDLLYRTTIALNAVATSGASADHSTTNTQEAGVDEADIVETDGQFVYTFSHGKLVIVDVSDTSNPLLVSFTAFEDRYGEMYLQGDRITLIKRGYGKDDPSIVTVLDVADRSNPQIQERTEIAGRIIDSRAVGDRVFVAVSGLDVPAVESSVIEPASEEGHYEIRTNETLDEYVARLRADLIEASLPSYETFNGEGEVIASGLLTDPVDIHKPIDAVDNKLTSLVTFDVADGEAGPDNSTGIFTSNAAHVYMSGSSFYVMRGHGSETAIFKFAVDEDGVATLAATGKFDGWLLNQFSVDEYEGRLRIATTQDVMETVLDHEGREIMRQQRRFNNLLVLEQDGTQLAVVGEITNLAPTELIKSVRFLEDRAYVTTFRIVDPLFTIDLSDPSNPEVKGALKIPGFSDYLHPVGEDYIIGIGRDADEITGQLGSLQISLFYVGDMDNPTLVDQVTMEGAHWHWSEAWYDHHAVAYFAEDQVLTIPVSWYEWTVDEDTGSGTEGLNLLHWGMLQTFEQHSAIWAFEIDVDGVGGGSIDIGGSVDHVGEAFNQARRSVRVGDALITLSDDYLLVNNLHDVDEQLAQVYLGILPRDDRFDVAVDGVSVTLDVRANDRIGVAGTVPLIVGVTQPKPSGLHYWGGLTDAIVADSILTTYRVWPGVNPGTVEISEDGTSLIYTPKEGFYGTATFTYTVFDELRGEQEATVMVIVAATVQIVEISPGTPTILEIAEPVVLAAPVDESVESASQPEAPVPSSGSPVRLNLPNVVAIRGTEKTSPVATRSAAEVTLLNASFDRPPASRPARRVSSLVRDDIFDTFHATRLRSVSEMPDELFAELAVEVAGLD